MSAVYALAAALRVLNAMHTVFLVLFAAAAVFLAAGFAWFMVRAADGRWWLHARRYRRMRRENTGGQR